MKDSVISHFCFGALFVLSLCLILSCSKDPLLEAEDITYDLSTPKAEKNDIIEGHYIVVLSTLPGKENPQALAALEALSKEVGQMPEANISRKYSHVLTGFAAKLTDKQVEKLRKDPRVENIEPDSYIYPSGEVAVQQYPVWGLDKIDQRESLLNRAYAFTASGTGVTAYIIDSGIRYSHNEFGGRASLGYDFVLQDDPENTDPEQEPGEDCMGHGTHVAGTVGGNTVGVAKNVNLVSVRVFGCTGATPRSRYVAAIDWITANAAYPAVVNMSLGFTDDPENQVATDAAVSNAIAAGLNFTISAGNSNDDACKNSPARVTEAITVGASDIDNNRASFSSYGTCLDLYAPGVSISSASNEDDVSYKLYNGTSMSAPHVAGVVALFLEVNPTSTPAQVHSAIVENTTPNLISNVPSGPNNLLYSLWEPVEFVPPTPPDLMFQATGEKVRSNYVANLTWNLTEAHSIRIIEDGVVHFTEHYNDGEQQIRLRDKGRNATYILQICEVGYDNCSEEITLIFGDGGTEPVNASPSAGFNYSINVLDVQFTDTSSDPDGSIVAWDWDFGDNTFSSEQNPFHSFNEAGSYSVKLIVTDNGGSSSSHTKSITVGDQEPPTAEYELTAEGSKEKGKWRTLLTWSSVPEQEIDIFRNGTFYKKIPNSGYYWDFTDMKGSGTLTYKICGSGTSSCSNEVTVQF
ncbi:S8 family serine peptidase [Salinimicrobium xinjiangense]|uniref:S8 family serine peptidase n=1 Tax=Salinimicrobium xinjiangense TaxID=438596 RepID=UPI00040D3CCE|nr:S8 family serine peptidase [Salinimicrobium xinjiangense]